jgi:hypothetical protein
VDVQLAGDVGLVAIDTAVGLAYIGAAAVARGPRDPRWLFGLVGLAWLLGGLVASATFTHAGVLFVAVATFPVGLRSTPSGIVVATVGAILALSIPVAGIAVPPLLVATLFAGAAVRALIRFPEEPVAYAYPFAASAAVAVALVASSLIAYQLTMLGVAVFFPVALGAIVSNRAALADRLLDEHRPAGVPGLAAVLREAVGDPDLRIVRTDDAPSSAARLAASEVDPSTLAVEDQGKVIAVVTHHGAALEDPLTSSAVREAVRLAVLNERLQADLDGEVHELEAARGRLLLATDRQRALIADRLRTDVVAPVQDAERLIRGVTLGLDDEASDALRIAQDELAAVADDLLGVVGGVAPVPLGGGGLVEAVRAIAARSPVHVSVDGTEEAIGSPEAEAALFYVCSEAITNAIKHASASRIDVSIERHRDELVARIVDDGRGGADPRGSGLEGLAARLAARGGRLRVESPRGAGTVIVAAVPR